MAKAIRAADVPGEAERRAKAMSRAEFLAVVKDKTWEELTEADKDRLMKIVFISQGIVKAS